MVIYLIILEILLLAIGYIFEIIKNKKKSQLPLIAFGILSQKVKQFFWLVGW